MREFKGSLLALTFVLAGCGAVAPPSARSEEAISPTAAPSSSPTAFETLPFDLPPEVTIHGVAGKPSSWCWGGCVDGAPGEPGALPIARQPLVVSIPADSYIESATVSTVQRGPGNQYDLEIEGTHLVGTLPPGAVSISVSLRWPDGRDATYHWALASDT